MSLKQINNEFKQKARDLKSYLDVCCSNTCLDYPFNMEVVLLRREVKTGNDTLKYCEVVTELTHYIYFKKMFLFN